MSDQAPALALIADIHGNSWALDAVLADMTRRGITRIINLGDSLDGSVDPAGTAARLLALGGRLVASVRGNGERLLLANLASARPQTLFTRLDAPARAWLDALPPTCQVGEIFCCHGTPDSDATYLLEEVRPDGVVQPTGEADLSERLRGVPGRAVVCAHSHLPRTVRLPDGRLVVNPGSVGLPAYTDDQPFPHAMEAGSPHARYAVLTHGAGNWEVEHLALGYPWDQAADAARRDGRPDRAAWIATGRASLNVDPSPEPS